MVSLNSERFWRLSTLKIAKLHAHLHENTHARTHCLSCSRNLFLFSAVVEKEKRVICILVKHVVVNASLCSVKIDKDHCEKLYWVQDTTLKMSDEKKSQNMYYVLLWL